MRAAVMSSAEIDALLKKEFPQSYFDGCGLLIEHVAYGSCRVRRKFSEHSVRPGGTISGPTMMGLADFALYVAVFSVAGPVPLAVTTNLSINFLRKPKPADLIAEGRLLKHGKRLAVGEVGIHSDGDEELVAHVTATYSIPPGA